MRWIVWILLILSAAVGLALVMRFNHGNVAILWPPYRVEFSVNFAVLVALFAFGVFHVTMVAIGKAVDLPARVREYRQRRLREVARTALRDSVLALFEGRFGRAERLAQSAREDEMLAGPAALVAARAAHRMREFERRDRWLALAAEDKGSANAELMTAAELALEEQDAARAIAAIERLHGKGLRHIHALRVALRAYELSEDWASVLHVLRLLEKRDALPDAAIRGLKVRACRAMFARRAGDVGAVRDLWSSLRPAERALPEAAEAAAAAFAECGLHEQSRRLIDEAMQVEISPILLPVFVNLVAIPTRERIQQAENWRRLHGDDADLLLALGRLCMAESIWGKAEEYLNRSIAVRDAAPAHLALAELGEAIGRQDMATVHYRAAARAAGIPGTRRTPG